MSELDFGPEARTRWTPPADELRRLGHAVVELLVDHLAGDDDEALALVAAVAARPDAFAELRFFARLAAEAHRASTVFDRLLFDLGGARPVRPRA